MNIKTTEKETKNRDIFTSKNLFPIYYFYAWDKDEQENYIEINITYKIIRTPILKKTKSENAPRNAYLHAMFVDKRPTEKNQNCCHKRYLVGF